MSEYNLPNLNNTLFTSGNYNVMSHIPKTSSKELLDRYIKGYKKSAELGILEIVKESHNNALKDQLIYPIIFNYRQMLELLLKKYYIKYSINTNFRELTHELVPIWNKVEIHFRNAYSNVDSKDLEEKIKAVNKYITEFDTIDKGSFVFRYPFNRDANFTETITQEYHIDVVNLGQRMEELYKFLFNADDYLNIENL